MAAEHYPDAYYLRKVFSYDPDTGVLRWLRRDQWHFADKAAWQRWNKQFPGRVAGGPRKQSKNARNPLKRIVSLDQINLSRTHVIWIIMTGKRAQGVIDHINGNKFDDRWINLREATHSQNVHNRVGMKRRNVSTSHLPKGVYHSGYGRFYSQIMGGKKIEYLGTFDTAEEAHEAYCKAGRRLHGEFFESRTKR